MVQNNPQHSVAVSQIHCCLSNVLHQKSLKKLSCTLVLYIYTFVCVCVNAHAIMTFMYACMDLFCVGLHVIGAYKIGLAPRLSCAPLA